MNRYVRVSGCMETTGREEDFPRVTRHCKRVWCAAAEEGTWLDDEDDGLSLLLGGVSWLLVCLSVSFLFVSEERKQRRNV